MAFTQTSEKVALTCLSSHEWKLDLAVDNFFQFPERYSSREVRSVVDRKRIEQLFNRYRGATLQLTPTIDQLIRYEIGG